MSEIIGYVSQQAGQVNVTHNNGANDALAVHMAVHMNDMVQTGDNGALLIVLDNGNVLRIGPNQSVYLDETVYESQLAQDEVQAEATALQQLLADSGDLTNMEETAAGQESVGSSGLLGDGLTSHTDNEGYAYASPLDTQSALPAFAATPINPQPTLQDAAPVNAAPVFDAPSYAYTLPEGTLAGSSVGTATATDSDGDTLTYVLTDSVGGLFAIDAATGEISVTRDIDDAELGNYVLEVIATDPLGATGTTTVTVDFTNVDDPTVLTLTAGTATEGVTVAGDAVATFTLSDADETPSVDFTPGTNDQGYYAIVGNSIVLTTAGETYLNLGNALPLISLTTSGTSTDVSAAALPTTALIGNTAPEIQNTADIVSVAENTTAVGNYAATDPDGDAVTYTLAGADADKFTIDAAGNVSFIVAPDYDAGETGPYNIIVVATDDGRGALVDTQAVTINVTNVNDAPVAENDGPVSTDEDTPLNNINVLGNDSDVDGDPLTVTTASALNGTVSINADGTLNYAPNANYNGPDTITYEISDGQGGTASATVSVTVLPVNDPTAIGGDIFGSGDEDNVITGTLTASDADGLTNANVFSVSSVALYGTATIDPTSGAWSYTPNADYNGSDTFSVTVTDDAGNTTVQPIHIIVNAVADITNDILTTDEDTAITANVLTGSNGATADNFEGSPVLSGVTQGSNGSVTFDAAGNVTYIPDANYNGTDSFTYTVTSGGVTETATVYVMINAVNDPATLGSADVALDETNAPLTTGGTLSISDVDSPETFQAQSNTAGSYGQFSIDTAGNWSYTANDAYDSMSAGESVSDTFTVASYDGTLTYVTVTIRGTNDAPVAGSTVVEATEDMLYTLTLGDFGYSDVEGDIMSAVRIDTLPANGTLLFNGVSIAVVSQEISRADIEAGKLEFIAAPDESGSAYTTFTFSVYDGTDWSASSATTTINVAAVADVIPVEDVSIAIGDNQPLVLDFDIIGSSLDGLTSYTSPNGITVSASSGSFSYSNGSLLGVGTPQSDGGEGIAGTEAINFSFPVGIQSMTMTLKNASNDTVLLNSEMRVDTLPASMVLSGTLISSSVTDVVSASNAKVVLLINGTETYEATITSGGAWSVDYSAFSGSITSATLISYVDGSLFNNGGQDYVKLTTTNGEITDLSISQDLSVLVNLNGGKTEYRGLFSQDEQNDGFQIEAVAISPNNDGSTVNNYPIDMYAAVQDTVGTAETVVSLVLNDLPSDAVISVLHADGTYTEITADADGKYDLSAYVDRLGSATGTDFVDQMFILTSETIDPLTFQPTIEIGVQDGTDVAYSIIGGSTDQGTEVLYGTDHNDYIDGGNAYSNIDGGLGDDLIVFGSGMGIQGGDGNDTLLVSQSGVLDFGNVHNIETIDLSQGTNGTVLDLNIADVFSMTDSDNTLMISGTSTQEHVSLTNATGAQVASESINNVLFDIYTYTDATNQTAIVKIQHDINETTL